ncbi:collagen alpha-1(I) chain-like [Pseudopipra pipra]|uniref:collagen alpha-1(I) chain-like n=1 Tax=Pseudopipra pipra TaxID=415032 RepID=UPI0031389BE4
MGSQPPPLLARGPPGAEGGNLLHCGPPWAAGAQLPHHGLCHGLQGNLCSGAWDEKSSKPSEALLFFSRSHTHTILTPAGSRVVHKQEPKEAGDSKKPAPPRAPDQRPGGPVQESRGEPGHLRGTQPRRKRGPRTPPPRRHHRRRRSRRRRKPPTGGPTGHGTRPRAPIWGWQRSRPRCPPAAPAAPLGEGAPGSAVPTQPPRGAGPRTVLAHGYGSSGLERLPGRGIPAGANRHNRAALPAQLSPHSCRPSRRPRGAAPAAARQRSSPRLGSPHGAAGALRSPAQHKRGLNPSLREVSCHRSSWGKQKLQSREREEEEEGKRKRRSERHCSPAAPLPSAADSCGGQPAQRRLPIGFGGASAARAAPRKRRTEEQAGEPAPLSPPCLRPSLPGAGSSPRTARPAAAAPPSPARAAAPPPGGARTLGPSGSHRPRCPWALPMEPPRRPSAPQQRAARAGLSRSARPPLPILTAQRQHAVPVKVGGVSLKTENSPLSCSSRKVCTSVCCGVEQQC